jgi:drug/metabolite transporter (DMT)-like permease
MFSRDQAVPSRDLCLLLLLGLLWGIPYALNKIALESIPPVTLVAARVCLAAAALWIVVWLTGCKISKTKMRAPLVRVLLVQGCLSCLIPYVLIAIGQQSVDSALAAILNSTTPLFVCLLVYLGSLLWRRDESLPIAKVLGVLLGFCGVVLIAGVGALAGVGQTAKGQLAIIIATISSAVGVLYGRRLKDVPPEFAAAGTLTCAAIVLVPLSLCIESPLQASPSWPSIAALMGNALAATALGFVVYFHLLRTIGSVPTSSAGYLKPTIGVLIGCALMAEPLTWQMGVGLTAILVGIAITNHPPGALAIPKHPAAGQPDPAQSGASART